MSESASDPAAGAQRLDVRGLQCPLPVLRAKKMLNTMEPGALLEVHATDPGAVPDFRSLCAQTGHALLVSREEQADDGPVYVFLIRKS